ncbi:hypothetical protein HID58_095587 [Brassica napus]|uniref:Uncharacterized protein n=1 Tax=Brassica napus TaxID=3708 RepID=A0ABQ7X347_BRANA|nr:hypothetical protein HID58_095587 [Brassica napus]
MNDLQLLGEINSPTSFNFLELQGCAAPAVNNSRNPNPQISATNEIVPEEIESEATSAQTKSVVPPIVAAQQNIEQPNAQPPRLPTVPEEGVKSKVALWKDKHSSEACPRSTVPQESNVPKRNGKAPIASQFPIVGTGNDKGPGIARATPKALPKEKPKASAPPPASNKKGKRQNNKQWAPTEGNKRTDADSRAQMYQAGPSTDPKTITLDLEEGEICVDLRPINLDPGSHESVPLQKKMTLDQMAPQLRKRTQMI